MKPTPATAIEMQYLTAQVEALRYRLPHPIADMAGVAVAWDNQDGADRTGTTRMALFTLFRPNRITLAGFGRHTLNAMVPTLCHELHHKWQLDTWGYWPYMCRCLLRNFLVEKTAYEVEQAADKLIEIGAL
jgi:hypothetical protein